MYIGLIFIPLALSIHNKQQPIFLKMKTGIGVMDSHRYLHDFRTITESYKEGNLTEEQYQEKKESLNEKHLHVRTRAMRGEEVLRETRSSKDRDIKKTRTNRMGFKTRGIERLLAEKKRPVSYEGDKTKKKPSREGKKGVGTGGGSVKKG